MGLRMSRCGSFPSPFFSIHNKLLLVEFLFIRNPIAFHFCSGPDNTLPRGRARNAGKSFFPFPPLINRCPKGRHFPPFPYVAILSPSCFLPLPHRRCPHTRKPRDIPPLFLLPLNQRVDGSLNLFPPRALCTLFPKLVPFFFFPLSFFFLCWVRFCFFLLQTKRTRKPLPPPFPVQK